VIPFVLSERPLPTTKFPNGHYIIPDTNAFLNGMDLFESPHSFRDVIILQTVLEEVKNRSIPLYHRLVNLTKDDEKRFYVFFNEFRSETYASRDNGETINDRNDRAVRKATAWYNQHLRYEVQSRRSTGKSPSVVMISDDKENLKKAAAEGVPALSCELPWRSPGI
jgi:exosome complex exonuclease DIS3/RRP44